MASYSVGFGEGIKNSLEEEYNEAKETYGLASAL
jgi:hypothetical protein